MSTPDPQMLVLGLNKTDLRRLEAGELVRTAPARFVDLHPDHVQLRPGAEMIVTGAQTLGELITQLTAAGLLPQRSQTVPGAGEASPTQEGAR